MHSFARIRLFALLVVGMLAMMAGCPETTNTGVLPATGVDIDIGDLLSGANLTCGTGPGQVYKYVGIVNDDADAAAPPIDKDCPVPKVAGGVFDCYSLGTFGNLPLPDGGAILPDGAISGELPDGGTFTYSVRIYFFTYDAYNANASLIQSAVTPGDRGGGDNICQLPWSWATTCTAIEEDNIIVNASCAPVVAAPDASTTDASRGDVTSRDSAPDAPSETGAEAAPTDGAGSEAAPDAPSDAPTDAPHG